VQALAKRPFRCYDAGIAVVRLSAMEPEPSPPRLQFARFVFDPRAGELTRQGVRVRIQDKPLRLLQLFLRRPGELVTRAELQKELWPESAFLDFEDGLNTAIRKVREALGDAADKPRFLETVPRHGYRWIAEVAVVTEPAMAPPVALPPPAFPPVPAPEPTPISVRRRPGHGWPWAFAAAACVLAAAAWWLVRGRAVFAFRAKDSVLIADMDNQTGQPRLDQALNGALTVSLEQSGRLVVFPQDRLPTLLRLLNQPAGARVTAALGREICQREDIRALIVPGITRTGRQYDLTAELIDPSTGAVVRSYSQPAAGSDQILAALGLIANSIRRDLGESLLQVRADSRPLPEVTTPSLAALQDYADGQRQWARGRFQSALALYGDALHDDPGFAMAHAALASADCSYVYYAETACRAQYALALANPSRLTAREREFIAASQADDTGDFVRARTLYRNYLSQYPDDWSALNNYAHLLRMHGEQAQAIPVYQQLERVAPDDARTQIELATAEGDLGNYGAALAAYRRAFRLDPHWELAGDTNREYGFTLVRAGHPRQALAAFRRLESNPALRSTALDSEARLDFWQGRLAAARAAEEQSLLAAINPPPLTVARRHLLLAQLAEAGGDRAAAATQLDAALARFDALEPKVAWGALVGLEWLRLGGVNQAQAILNRIAPLADPHNLEDAGYVRVLRASLAVAQGRPRDGIAILGLPDPADGTSVYALTQIALARAEQQAGDLRQASRWFQAAAGPPQNLLGWEPQPRAQTAYYWLARDQLALHHPARARAAVGALLHLLAAADASLPLRRQAQALAAQLPHSD
jgi:DNA-binding winged helix-turn-helix (wHTH) protein/Flp pilus assembly protein TadD